MGTLLIPVTLKWVLWGVAGATPLLAGGGWFFLPRGRKARPWHLPLLALFGIGGPLLGVLWVVFNAIENFFGLDSLLGLFLNLVFFAATGAAVGGWLKVTIRMRYRYDRETAGGTKKSVDS